MSRLLKSLQYLQKHGRQCAPGGICLHLHPADIDNFLTLAKGWPEHSGDYEYPVPTPPIHKGVLSAEGAYDTLPRWLGEYGDARRRLLDWAIEELQHAL